MLCSILLVGKNGRNLVIGAAPSLPKTTTRQLRCSDRSERWLLRYGCIGKPVIVSDISDPLWVDFRDLALSYGLRACWSTPILSTTGNVLGTFAMYYREPATLVRMTCNSSKTVQRELRSSAMAESELQS